MSFPNIPKQIWFSLGIEGVLIAMTLLLLTEPGLMIRPRGPALRKAFVGGGLVFLCITFFWSFILGHLIAIFHISRQALLGE